MSGPSHSWFIVVPPEGAAREAGLETADSCESLIGRDCCKIFDCRKYLDFFSGKLKSPDENLVVDLVNHALAVQCLDFGATDMLVCALSPVTLFTLNLLRAHRVATSHWFYEDFRRTPYWKFVLAGYDRFFAIQKGPLPGLCAQSGCAYHFLPTAAARSCCIPYGGQGSPQRTKDIAFIGIPSAYRIEMLEFLADAGLSLSIAGLGWDSYAGPLVPMIDNDVWTDTNRAIGLLNDAKTGLNLSIVSPDVDRANTHISPRAFDVLASGCALVTENVPLAHETLKGLHYHTFTNKVTAAQAARAIVSDFDREKALSLSNKSTICQEHTYANRVRTILQSAGGR
jgi:hypothetical protein